MDLKQKTFLVITGASRGIGQSLAIELACKLQPSGSKILLMGRNLEGLEQTKAKILAATTNGNTPAPTVLVIVLELATATAADFKKIINSALKNENQPTDFERSIIIHNAGTVGNIAQYARDTADTAEWSNYYAINLFSAVALNSVFMHTFVQVPKLVINISTKCAIEPFASMTYYCSLKAAKDMYFKVLALEEPSEQTLVLNYAPGAIDTQMSLQVQQQTHNEMLANAFRQQRETKTMLLPEQTAAKLISILEAQKFESGDHVDYWD